ncbi:MAG: STAS/SEC14 domain-containing protein [Planctomycetaceae bacterium]
MPITIHEIDFDAPVDSNVVNVRISGKLTKEDYELFVPAMDEVIRQHGQVRILMEMVDFHGWTLSATWEDTKFALKHFHDIERLALVGDKAWEKGMAVFCKPFTRASIKYFDIADIAQAKSWIAEA